MFDLAKQCVDQFPNLKVIILTRLARYDLPSADPNGLKNKLSEYGNHVFSTLWAKNGCPTNIVIGDQKLGCYGELQCKRFGQLESPGFDGIHMRGPLGKQHYTNAILRIFKGFDPELKAKQFPKITKPRQMNFTPRTNAPNQGLRKPVYTDRRNFDDRRSNRRYEGVNRRYEGENRRYEGEYRRYEGENRRNEGENSDHWNCPQARYQRSARVGFVNPETGFTLPTQNRFATFYNNQGNF